MGMRVKIEETRKQHIFFSLCLIFFCFYAVQISPHQFNSDVLVYACRAQSDSPILDTAFLDHRYLALLGETPLPNYHLGHTTLLWIIYRLVPRDLAMTTIPSSMLSALCGALMVGLTFLIGNELGFSKYGSLVIAIVSGIIPSIWRQSLIGEVYTLQLFFIVLFVYWFLRNRLSFSALAFSFANLVSPLSALSFPLLFLRSRDRKTISKAIGVGGCALMVYVIFFIILKLDVLRIFQLVDVAEKHRSVLWHIYKFGLILILNINFLVLFLMRGVRTLRRDNKPLLIGLTIAGLPYLILPLMNKAFVAELGSTSLVLFWILSIPIGLSISQIKRMNYGVLGSILGLIVLFQLIWVRPANHVGRSLQKAGEELRLTIPEDIKIVGGWKHSIGVVIGKYGWDYERLCSQYLESVNPTEDNLIKIDDGAALVVVPKVPQWKKKIGKKIPIIPFTGMHEAFADQDFKGSVRLAYENDLVSIYLWNKAAIQTPED